MQWAGGIKIGFTIQVEKRKKDEEFRFKDLELFHQECMGGRIEKQNRTISHEPPKWELTCQRCDAMRIVYEEVLTGIVATSIDGQERKFKEDIRVIQKTET